MIRRFRIVVPNKLYRGSAPSPKDVMWLKYQMGIKRIVSLDKAAGNRIDRACKLLGIQHIKMYIENNRTDLLRLLSQDFRKLFLKGGPTFIHCHEGKDRSGLVSALIKCKFMGMDPETAIKEAKSLGFGVGLPENITKLYEKIIRSCKPSKDQNNADIVSNEREYIGDNRDSFLDEVHKGDFSSFLDHTRQNPMDAVYTYITDRSPTRQNYPDTSLFQYDSSKSVGIPNVGEYDNDAGMRGMGPSESYNGFFSEVGK